MSGTHYTVAPQAGEDTGGAKLKSDYDYAIPSTKTICPWQEQVAADY